MNWNNASDYIFNLFIWKTAKIDEIDFCGFPYKKIKAFLGWDSLLGLQDNVELKKITDVPIREGANDFLQNNLIGCDIQ